MIFAKGIPGVISGEFYYFQMVERAGFMAAHRQMLQELKTWLEANRPGESPYLLAKEAFRIHASFVRLVLSCPEHIAARQALDGLFAEMYGFAGRSVLERERCQPACPEPHAKARGLPHLGRPRAKRAVLQAVRAV